MLKLACGIKVFPGMTREELLNTPSVKELIHRRAFEDSLGTFEYQMVLTGSAIVAVQRAADNYTAVKDMHGAEVLYAVRGCTRRRAEKELESRVSAEIMALAWQSMSSDPDIMFGEDLSDAAAYMAS